MFRGARAPLLVPLETSQFIHGEDGIGGIGLPLRGREPYPGHAVDALLETAERYPARYTGCVGAADQRGDGPPQRPSFARKVKECVMMGGAADHLGNITPVAEFNVSVDPEAAKVVLSSGTPLKMVGLDVCGKHAVFTPEESAKLRGLGTPLQSSASTSRGSSSTEWDGGFKLADPIAIAMALVPEVATRVERRFVAVETGGEWCRGQTVGYRQEIAGIVGEHEPNVEVVEEAWRERYWRCCTEPSRRDLLDDLLA